MSQQTNAPKFLEEIENKLKDFTQGYLVVCIHDEKVWHCFSSNVAAHGMATMIQKNIERIWDEDGRE